jgi:hypothetical protein
LWHRWNHRDRPWKHLLKVTDKKDRQLFFSSTHLHIGDGKNTPFWESRWLQGEAPKNLAPNLYVVARFKFRNVHIELTNDNWIRNLKNVTTPVQLEEFTLLFMALSSVTLNDQKDLISWKWNANGKISAASAYNCQFNGAMVSFSPDSIWRAICEPKCRFFGWLAMHNKVPTTDNMLKKNWPCGPICPLYFCMEETTPQLLTSCNFLEAVWNIVATNFNLHNFSSMSAAGGPQQWLQVMQGAGSAKDRRKNSGNLLTCWWIIWKERNAMIF